MKILVLGNTAPKEVHRDDSGEAHHRALDVKRTETEFHFPDERTPMEALRELIDAFCGADPEDPALGYHADAAPAWVAGDERIATLVAAHFDCPVGVSANWRKLQISDEAKEVIGDAD